MSRVPRVLALATAFPPFHVDQDEVLETVRAYVLGADWRQRPELAARSELLRQRFAAARVAERQSAIDLRDFYRRPRTTGERMAEYARDAYAIGREALQASLTALAQGQRSCAPRDITDLVVVSCTGYTAPGLDILLARDLGLAPTVRRTVVGHMGCFGALVGLRQCLMATRAYPESIALLLSVELCSLHLLRTDDPDVLTAYALFGDAAAALALGADAEAPGPEIVATHSAAAFEAADQMTWTITDEGFKMTLSPRVPVTLRRNIAASMEALLAPHVLGVRDIAHWVVHPGGPSILEAIQRQLGLGDEAMALSWQVLRDHGNCSSATVLLILDELLRSGRPRAGEWGVVMAFGPGLTLESCLLRF